MTVGNGLISKDPKSLSGIYDDYELSLIKVDIPSSRIVDGNEFPYVLNLTANKEGSVAPIDTELKFLKDVSSLGIITDLLIKHGAVLIKGLGHSSAEDFSKFIRTIEESRGRIPFQQIGLAGQRNELAPEVFTANEGPPDRRFFQHNEYDRFNHFPSNIHFFCHKAAEEGGETPIAHSRELFEAILKEEPEFVKDLARRGLGMTQIYPGVGNEGTGNKFNWEGVNGFGHLFEEGDSLEVKKVKLEKMIRKLTDDFEWLPNGDLRITQHVPLIRIHPITGKPVWFNGLAGRHGAASIMGALDHPENKGTDGITYSPTTYDDGTSIERKVLDKVLAKSLEIEFAHKWEEGDLCLIDNFQTTHGRSPWTKGDRVIIVSMWDDGNEKPKSWSPDF